MEEEVKIIEIPNFITIKIVKINENYCAYYVEDYSNEYFYNDEGNFLKIQLKARSLWALSLDMPMIVNNISIKHLEKDIYKLHKELDKELDKELTKDKIPRAEENTKYYFITPDFEVEEYEERNDGVDNILYNSFNYFTSESQAREFASKMQDYLIQLWKEEREKK